MILINLVNKYPDKPWDWELLSQNPNIKFDDFLKYLDLLWNWICLSLNRKITLDIV